MSFFAASVGTASAQGDVTVGGQVEVIGGISDHVDGHDGFDRGLFSRIIIGYANTLENGLEVSANISYQLNQRGQGAAQIDGSDVRSMMEMMTADPMMDNTMIDVTGGVNQTNYAPDVLALSVGGGFGTVTMGAHATATCSLLLRTIGLTPGGVNAGWYQSFTGVDGDHRRFYETEYCSTPEAISYATPTMGGFRAMATYAPNNGANQGTSLQSSPDDAATDRIDLAVQFSADMGAANVTIAAGMQSAKDDALDEQAIGGQVGLGGLTAGADWFDRADGATGYNIGARYALGALSPGIVFSTYEDSADSQESNVMSIGATYALGGGFSFFGEFMDIEFDDDGTTDEDTVIMSGVIVAF